MVLAALVLPWVYISVVGLLQLKGQFLNLVILGSSTDNRISTRVVTLTVRDYVSVWESLWEKKLALLNIFDSILANNIIADLAN